MFCKRILEAHRGQSFGSHSGLGSVASVSSGMFFAVANCWAAAPSVRSVPTAVTVAPQDSRSSKVPRTAEPALMTSLMMATRWPFRGSRRGAGIRYPAGKSAGSGAFEKRSE